MTTPLARLNSRPSAWLYLGGGKRPRVRSADATGARPSACACVQVCGSLLSCSVRTLPSIHASRMRVHVLCDTHTCPWSDLQATSVPDQPRVYGLWVRVSIVGTSFPIRLVVSARMKLQQTRFLQQHMLRNAYLLNKSIACHHALRTCMRVIKICDTITTLISEPQHEIAHS